MMKMNPTIRVGFAREEITPKIPVPMSGFAGTRLATEVHDPLYANVMVIKKNEELFVMSVLDLLSVDVELLSSVRSKVDRLGIKGSNVQIMATHTHSGPVGINDSETGIMQGASYFLGNKDSHYINYVSEKIVQAIKSAVRNLQAQTIKIGKSTVSGISSNRSRKNDEYDNVVLAFEFSSESNEKNLFLRFSCHPTVFDSSNTLISADFPASLYQRYADKYKHTFFINGACGDISTRHTRKSSDFNEIERMGRVLEEVITESLLAPFYEGTFDSFEMNSKCFTVETKKPGNIAELKRKYQKMEEGIEKISVRAELEYAKRQKQRPFLMEAGAVEIQGMKFTFLPVEIYSSLILAHLTENIFFSGFANGYYTYLPDSKAYERGEYEAHMSPFAMGEGERLISKVSKWLKELE